MNNLFKNWKDLINQWFGRSYFDQINQQDATRLATYFQRIQYKHPDNPLVLKISKQLENTDEIDWNQIKSIELLLIPLLDKDDLDIELLYQLNKAQVFLPQYEADFFSDQFERINRNNMANMEVTSLDVTEEQKRALLTKLTASLQKFYEDRQLRSIFANKARFKIGLFFSLAIFGSVFFLAIGILHPDGIYQYCARYCPKFTWVTSITAAIPEPTATQQVDKIHLHFAISALMAGFMGSCFSMLISLKGRVESITLKELENLHKLHFILTRIITGVGAALICYYFFRAQLLSGSLFPDFSKSEEIRLNSKTYFTLIIWCFIAGFSEKLVPNILTRAEEQLADKRP